MRETTTTTSTTLLDGLHEDDNHALWREFDARYRPIITGFARRMGLRRDDAADVAQESLLAFLRAYRAGKYDRDRGRLRTWLMMIVRSRVLDRRRAEAKRRERRGSSGIVDLPQESDLDQIWEAERRAGLLRQAMQELRDKTRISEKTLRAFELYVLKEQPASTVATELGMTAEDVYMAKNRVAERLRAIVTRLDRLFDDG